MTRDESIKKGAGAQSGSDAAPADERTNIIITIVLMAIFLTWIGCAVAVWAGWAI